MKKRNSVFTYLMLFVLLGFGSSCSKSSNYVYYENTPAIEVDKRIYPLKLLEGDKNVDIMFVIDNSGSMATIQNNVIKNARIFLEEFAKQPYINWKIGIISTDKSEDPFLGFNTAFDWNLINYNDPTSFDRTVTKFQGAVSDLGVQGSPWEHVLYNVKRVIDLYNGSVGFPAFLRSNSHLAVIMITDETEQSEDDFGAEYTAPNFLKSMSKYVSGNKKLRFYGALSRIDLPGCGVMSGDSVPYAGSVYEEIINLSQGFNISACKSDFGVDLARIGRDIASLVALPSLLLKERPLAETIKVYYRGALLPSGPKSSGGVWFYEEDTNTINFYTMDFVKDPENDYFKIDFDIDDGHSRG